MNDKENGIAYELGKIAQQEGAEDCLPFEDETFTAYVEKHDPPIVLSVTGYVDGFYAADNAAKARRAKIRLVDDSE